MAQAQHVAGNGAKRSAVRSRFAHHVVTHLKLDLFARQVAVLLAKKIRLSASRRTPLFNGAIECRLFEYRMIAGGNRRD